MKNMPVSIVTPKGLVYENTALSVTAPSSEGEITVLPRHERYFTLLEQGIVTIRSEEKEDYFSIGGGYLETDGREITILVSRAWGQHELDEQSVAQAKRRAQEMLQTARTKEERFTAMRQLRLSLIDAKLLDKTRRKVLS